MGPTVVSRTTPAKTKTIARNAGYVLAAIAAACGLHKWFSRTPQAEPQSSSSSSSTAPSPSRQQQPWRPSPDDEDDSGPYRLYGAKTSYKQVCETAVQPMSFPGCEPKQFWLLSRHGARYPGPWEMDALLTRLPRLRDAIVNNASLGHGNLTRDQVQGFQNWVMELKAHQDNQLTPEGEREVLELAERFKQRFPTLLGKNFSVETYHFRHTDSHRTANSARLFAVGLFGQEDVGIPSAVKDDPIIKFYKTCKKWKEEVDDNLKAREERRLFRRGPEMHKALNSVSHHLGFNNKLSFDDLHLMFTMCRFESAAHPNRTSPWCSVFTRDEVEVMEYDEDLDYYWTDGYGFPINYEQACPPVKDFLDHFRAVMKGESSAPLGVFRFSHSGLLLKVYARLGLFRDDVPPRADNFREQVGRQWRSSLIDPFTANLALVLFKCDKEFKLVAFVQERPVILPGCTDIICPMDTILHNYAALADTCDVTTICDGHATLCEPHVRKQRKLMRQKALKT